MAGLLLFVISMPLSKFTMSLAQIIIVLNWLLEGQFKKKLKLLGQNKPAIILMSLYLIHIIGLLNTTDFNYAFNDLRIKLPIFVIPFILGSTTALNRIEINRILLFLGLGVLISTLISLFIYMGFGPRQINDIRQISPFISHIRLALLVCIVMASNVYFFYFPNQIPILKNHITGIKVALVLSTAWLIVFLFILESLTGIFILFCAFIAISFYYIASPQYLFKNKLKYFFVIIVILSGTYAIVYKHIKPLITPIAIDATHLPANTINGNPYQHLSEIKIIENGHYYGLYHCESELKKEWSQHSSIPYDATDLKQQPIKYTLMRYLTSKGLPKDSLGLTQLSPKDIQLIEQGIPNYRIPSMNPLESRAYQVYFEYQSFKQGYNPSGHSLTMRLYYWQAALLIGKDHFFTGVGTGDLEQAFQDKYKQEQSVLEKPWRHRAHNQYLTMLVAFGVFGFLYFIFWLIAPIILLKQHIHPVYYAFLFVFLLSMLFEDTLETQAGVSFAIFFNSLFLLGNYTDESLDASR